MQIQFLGGAGTVTGSKHLLQFGDARWLVDCGLFQGMKELRDLNWKPLPVEAESLTGILVTHAHIDHIGYLPRFLQGKFKGALWSTKGTAKLAQVLLPDSGRLQEEEAAYHNKRGTSKHSPALPLYTGEDGEKAAGRFQGVDFGQKVDLGSGGSASFQPAGHILGSAVIHVEVANGAVPRRILFSGDVGRWDAPIMPDPSPVGDADYIVMESTYGDREHSEEPLPGQLERVVQDTIHRGGVLVVPAFAVGRTQEMLYQLDALERSGKIPSLPIYVDSPMAKQATEIYEEGTSEFDSDMQALVRSGRSPFHNRDLHTTDSVEESREINRVKGPAIILSASGMATAGRILHHLRRRLPDPNNTVLLVGYQAFGTRGRQLQEGAQTVRIFGEDVPVLAKVETIQGFSAHADANGLLRWLKSASRAPKRVFLVHGDPEPAKILAGRIEKELGWPVTVPQMGETHTLDS
ncbi:MAG TPA: MBL fold metallo-hydrolase [Candidatus Eisenbacteria bacterium]|nr:MBL fold metallo-hydrolase [Candidatus Eisenbacteria bacterium]